MDPISCLSLVSNIFQVVGFAGEVLKIAREIHRDGDASILTELERGASNANSTSELIKQSILSLQSVSATSQEDHDLIQLAEEAGRIGAEVRQLAENVFRKTGKNSPRSLVSRTFKTIWNQHTIEKLDRRLAAVRNELQFHLIAVIKNKLDRHDMQLEDALNGLDQQAQSNAQAVISALQDLKSQSGVVLDAQLEGEALAQMRHKELLSSILGIRGGASASTKGRKSEHDAQETILSSLWFSMMRDREEMIHQAYASTYGWIFRDPPEDQKLWDNFNNFLHGNDSRTYWITGKPGSGKSTLMKYLLNEDRTEEALRQWTSGKRPIIASFYFYYKGGTLQRSEVGVLRSMLRQILLRRRHLIEIAFPDWYAALRCGVHMDMESGPTYWELKRAFERVIKTASGDYFFLAVDGLDEYDADSAEMGLLVRTFKSLSELPNVKVLLSSRPWTVFEENFADCPRLEVHKLTRPDIAIYVDDQIHDHPHLQRLKQRNSAEIKKLTDEIVDASAGVFLWVYLVVGSLVEGLSNSDGVADLRRRFLELPTDLEELYLHMWNRVPSRYHSQASRILQTVDACTANGRQLSLLGLSLAEDDADHNGELLFKLPVGPLSVEDITARCESMKTRLLSRCFGLVEVSYFRMHPPPTGYQVNGEVYFNPTEDAFNTPHIVFLHRTVHEFIHSRNIGEMLRLAASNPYDTDDQFQPEVAALRVFILRIKTYQWHPLGNGIFSVTFARIMSQCLEIARLAEEASQKPQSRVLEELNDSTPLYFTKLNQIPQGGHWSSALNIEGKYPPERLTAEGAAGFLYLAARYGLWRFVQEQLSDMDSLDQSGAVLLHAAMHRFQNDCYFLQPYVPLDVVRRLLEVLTDHGADLQCSYFGKSACSRFFEWLSNKHITLDLEDIDALPGLVDVIISRGRVSESTTPSIESVVNKCQGLLTRVKESGYPSAKLQRFIAETTAMIKRLQSTYNLKSRGEESSFEGSSNEESGSEEYDSAAPQTQVPDPHKMLKGAPGERSLVQGALLNERQRNLAALIRWVRYHSDLRQWFRGWYTWWKGS